MTDSKYKLKSSPCEQCLVCGGRGKGLYDALPDRLFGVEGYWSLKKCNDNQCGLVWLDPMPNQDNISIAYENYYTHTVSGAHKSWLNKISDMAVSEYLSIQYRYLRKDNSFLRRVLGYLIYLHPGRKADADFSVMWMPMQKNNRLLEVGCGNGDALVRMQNLGWDVCGVDFDPVAVETAKSRGVQVTCGALENQNIKENSFDVITLSHLIEHVYDPLQLLKICYSLLDKDGQLVVLTPNSNSLWHKMFKQNWMPLDPPRHLHLFNEYNLKKLVIDAGFKTMKAKSVIRDANGVFYGSYSIKKTGHYDMSRMQPIFARFISRLAQLFEFIVNLLTNKYGEEVLIIAKK